MRLYAWLFTALSGLSVGAATVVTRTVISTEFAYLQHLQSTFPIPPDFGNACGIDHSDSAGRPLQLLVSPLWLRRPGG